MRPLRTVMIIVAVGVLCAVGYSTYAITAADTVPATKAGDGTGAVNAYTASGIAYSLNFAIPFNIDAVTFTLSPVAAGSVKVLLNGTVYGCTNTAGAVSCTTTSPQATVNAATTLKVVAAT